MLQRIWVIAIAFMLALALPCAAASDDAGGEPAKIAIEGSAEAEGGNGDWTLLPAAHLFKPLIADPREPYFSLSFLSYDNSIDTTNVASVGYGESFELLKYNGAGGGREIGLGISGGVFALFDIDSSSQDLIASDFTVGLPVTFRLKDASFRLKLYHQSSHLGDEFLLNGNAERADISYEALELLGSYELGAWRAYGGGEYMVRREPPSLEPGSLHFGLEYFGSQRVLGIGTPVAGVDIKSMEEHDWSIDGSLRAGLEITGEDRQRFIRVMLEMYKGFSPNWQFHDERLYYIGTGLYLGL